MYIPLNGENGRGLCAIVSVRDFVHVRGYRWHVSYTKRRPYAQAHTRRGGRATTIQMHKLIRPDAREIDHRSGNGLDNRRRNLRDASGMQNRQNRFAQANNSSGYRGVSFTKGVNKWMARGGDGHRGRREYLGIFSTAEEAARAYDRFARRRYGAFARLNFPRRGERSARR